MQIEPPAEPPGFTVTMTGETATVVLRGELDAAQLTFIDCASARLIAGTDGWLPPGVKPVITHPAPAVRRVLQASGLDARCELEAYGLP